MVPFAGYEMPMQFAAGILKEHLHVRAAAGLFDVSHMGQIIVSARNRRVADAASALESITPVDLLALDALEANMTAKTSLSAAIRRRRSIRRYRPDAIAPQIVERLLLAATQAPSAHNRQPWRFTVIDTRASREALAAAMGEQLRIDRTSDGHDRHTIDADVSRSYVRISEAPVVIVVSVDNRSMDSYSDARRQNAEYLMAVQSAAMATQNLLLAAEQEGLGACIMCAPLFCQQIVVDALKLPQDWQPQMLVTMGSPANAGKARPRLPLDAVVAWPSRMRDASSAG
jgi:F420 biosynthesis protein FbiB-like protein